MQFIILAGSLFPFYCTIDVLKPFYRGRNPLESLLSKHKKLYLRTSNNPMWCSADVCFRLSERTIIRARFVYRADFQMARCIY